MNANRRASLISNTTYVPPPPPTARIRAEIAADWHTLKVIVSRAARTPSAEAYAFFATAAIITGIGLGILL